MLKEHFERLLRSADILNLKVEFTLEDLEEVIHRFCLRLEGECYFKVYVSSDVYVEAFQIPESSGGGVLIGFSKFRKAPSDVIPAQLKVVSRSDVLLARRFKGRFYDAVMLSSRGCVAEGSFSNLFLVKDGKLVTPALECDVLDGITRRVVLDLARSEGFEVEERSVEVWELFEASEVFLTHTSRGMVKVAKLESKEYKGSELFEKLQKLFESFARGSC